MSDDHTNITVVTYNRLELTKRCLSSLLSLTKGDYSLHIIDNGSQDGTLDYLKALQSLYPKIKILEIERNMGVAVAANLGWVQEETSPYYLKLDNDIEILDPEWLKKLLNYQKTNPQVGLVGYHFLAKHQVQACTLPSGDTFWEFNCCGGAYCLVPKPVHEKLGFWNEDYGLYGFEDLEYSERTHLLGLRTGYFPSEGGLRHLGVENSASYQEAKNKYVEAPLSGSKIFFLNKLLFEKSIRPLYVIRRYLPKPNIYPLRFNTNPKYRPILHLHRKLMATIDYKPEGDQVSLNLTAWKNPDLK